MGGGIAMARVFLNRISFKQRSEEERENFKSELLQHRKKRFRVYMRGANGGRPETGAQTESNVRRDEIGLSGKGEKFL